MADSKCVGIYLDPCQQEGYRMDSRRPGSAGKEVITKDSLEKKGITKGGDVQRPAGYGPEKSGKY